MALNKKEKFDIKKIYIIQQKLLVKSKKFIIKNYDIYICIIYAPL